MPALRLFDAHNHLHDRRIAPFRDEILSALRAENVAAIAVNGSAEEDWPEVLTLALQLRHATVDPKAVGAPARVIPSFGYHPWYVKERSPQWESTLTRFLEQVPSAVGEIGLDRWIKGHDMADQQEVFVRQLRIAAERNLPVSIHCLQAWGPLMDCLRAGPRPACGFILHSFGGAQDLVGPLAELGAFFSLPGYYAHERKQRQRETFRHVPPERLLIETDAPDQPLPDSRVRHRLPVAGDRGPLNHPANLRAVYEFAAELLGENLEPLAQRIEQNFRRLFGRFLPA